MKPRLASSSREPVETKPAHIFMIRERPVGFRPSRFGGELVAVERGYFPVSGTGYRSLAGVFGFNKEVHASSIPQEFLESLAKAQDETRHAALRRVSRAPKPEAHQLGNFISASMAAETALNEGFFAPEPERRALWSGAYGVLCLIDTDARFQPKPDGGVWTGEACAKALATQRDLLQWVGELARGEFAKPRLGRLYCAHGYLGLPPKAGGEPSFALPRITAEFSLPLPESVPAQPIRRATRIPSKAAEATPVAQMSLF